MEIKYNWLPQGFTIEENDDHLLHIKYNGEIKATYNQTKVTEEILREETKNLEENIKNSLQEKNKK